MNNQKFHFFGRRKGRKLSIEKNKILNLMGPKFFFSKEDILKHINKLEGKNYLEVGFGSGENLIKFSQRCPQYNFFGAEPYVNSYITVLKNIYEKKINNIKIFPDDIRLVIDFFKNDIFSGIFLLHPDPWPKKKHNKRRLLQQSFIDSLSRILKKNGIIIIATDESMMKSWVLEQFHIRKDFEWKVKNLNKIFKKPNFFVQTKYSKKSIDMNNIVNWFFFKKK